MRFVDTSFLIALTSRRDARHDDAVALWRKDNSAVVTSNHVLGETWTFARRRGGHAAALATVDAFRHSPRATVMRTEHSVERDAWEWLSRHDEREYSFVDATSFALMRRQRWTEAYAFDGDFNAAGFVEIR